MATNNMGGADPVVSAVLGAIGKRYLVEKGSEDDGSEWEIYSDGFCVQRGIRPVVSQRQYTITLPKSYRDTKYFIMAVKCDPDKDGSAWIGTGIKTTTSFSFRQELANGNADNGDSNSWERNPGTGKWATYKRRVAWLWRNAAYGFDMRVCGIEVDPDSDNILHEGNPDIGDNSGISGKCTWIAYRKGEPIAWQWMYVKHYDLFGK